MSAILSLRAQDASVAAAAPQIPRVPVAPPATPPSFAAALQQAIERTLVANEIARTEAQNATLHDYAEQLCQEINRRSSGGGSIGLPKTLRRP